MEEKKPQTRYRTSAIMLRVRDEAKKKLQEYCREKKVRMTEYIRELIYRDSDITI
jgi:hypothetical protein